MRMIVGMNLDVLTPATAPPASRPVLDAIAADLGFVPNLAAVTATSPTLLAAFDALRRVVADPTFSPVHREIAGVAVGVAVDNAYGVAFHSTILASLGVDETEIDAMRAGREPSDPVHAAVYVFARDAVLQRGMIDEQVRQQAGDAGLTDADLLQLVAECTFAGLVGTVDNLAGRVPLDDFLRPRQWTPGVPLGEQGTRG
jgi:alkylhydroperoxidase family enzyme